LCVDCKMIVFRKADFDSLKNFGFSAWNLLLVFLQKSKSKEKYLYFFLFSKASLVMVLQLFKVKLTDGFWIWLSFSQYFTKAILLGAVQRNSFYVMRISSRIKSFVVNMKYKI
jgi:hypothetical protein